MIIYNVTIKVDWLIHEEWFTWMKDKHIPCILATGLFTGLKMVRLLKIDDTDGPTYAVQFDAESMDQFNEYGSAFEDLHRENVVNKWGNFIVDFSTLMEVVFQ
ncbi:MAG: DUF4286 family protein [Chitinophagaceae bacterium]